MGTAYDFTSAVAELADPVNRVGEGDLAIWAGQLPRGEIEPLEKVVERFLAAWDFAGMPYRIWEYTNRIVFHAVNALPNSAEFNLLERARVFGHRGDLALRRDSDCFYWHFVGPSDARLPPGFEMRNFWTDHPGLRLCSHDESALLWGKHQGKDAQGHNYWHDDRVGWAKLTYPHASHPRVGIHYTVYTDGGQVAFVWWKELRNHG